MVYSVIHQSSMDAGNITKKYRAKSIQKTGSSYRENIKLPPHPTTTSITTRTGTIKATIQFRLSWPPRSGARTRNVGPAPNLKPNTP